MAGAQTEESMLVVQTLGWPHLTPLTRIKQYKIKDYILDSYLFEQLLCKIQKYKQKYQTSCFLNFKYI